MRQTGSEGRGEAGKCLHNLRIPTYFKILNTYIIIYRKSKIDKYLNLQSP